MWKMVEQYDRQLQEIDAETIWTWEVLSEKYTPEKSEN